MAFVPRTFEVILSDMVNFVKVQTNLTDFEIGSIIRTILEAAALEDDEQYFQMVQLLDAFSYTTAIGSDLDARVADFDVVRLQTRTSAGKVVIQDLNLTRSTLLFNIPVGTTLIPLVSTAKFPTAGYPYTVRLSETKYYVEDITVTNNNTLTNILTLSAPVLYAHNIGELVSYVSGMANQTIGPGVQIQVPASATIPAIKFITIDQATIVNGNLSSTQVRARAAVAGVSGNVGVNTITQFASSPPFNGAGVGNVSPFSGGREVETDAQLRDRARGQTQALARGTVLAIQQAALGVADPSTGQSVVTSNVLERFAENEVILYIDDGTGFAPDTVALANNTMRLAVGVGAGVLTLLDATTFPGNGYVIVSPEDPTQIELIEYSAVNPSTGVVTLVTVTTRAHNIGDEVVLVDAITLNAEAGTQFLNTQNFPIVRNSGRVWTNNGLGFTLKSSVTDYFLNRGMGEIEFLAPLLLGTQVVAEYAYYTGLVKTVQTVIDGSIADPVDFPGVRAAGIILVVETPSIRRITVRVTITAQAGLTEAPLIPSVRQVIEAYISSLRIGENVIVSEIIQRVMEVTGIYNCTVITPVGDLAILAYELPVPFDSSGNSLVTVT